MVEGTVGWLPPNTQDRRHGSPEQSHMQLSMRLETVRQDKGHG